MDSKKIIVKLVIANFAVIGMGTNAFATPGQNQDHGEQMDHAAETHLLDNLKSAISRLETLESKLTLDAVNSAKLRRIREKSNHQTEKDDLIQDKLVPASKGSPYLINFIRLISFLLIVDRYWTHNSVSNEHSVPSCYRQSFDQPGRRCEDYLKVVTCKGHTFIELKRTLNESLEDVVQKGLYPADGYCLGSFTKDIAVSEDVILAGVDPNLGEASITTQRRPRSGVEAVLVQSTVNPIVIKLLSHNMNALLGSLFMSKGTIADESSRYTGDKLQKCRPFTFPLNRIQSNHVWNAIGNLTERYESNLEGYRVIGSNCIDFAQRVYQETGNPGHFLFASNAQDTPYSIDIVWAYSFLTWQLKEVCNFLRL